jgi:hypothetical protein
MSSQCRGRETGNRSRIWSAVLVDKKGLGFSPNAGELIEAATRGRFRPVSEQVLPLGDYNRAAFTLVLALSVPTR